MNTCDRTEVNKLALDHFLTLYKEYPERIIMHGGDASMSIDDYRVYISGSINTTMAICVTLDGYHIYDASNDTSRLDIQYYDGGSIKDDPVYVIFHAESNRLKERKQQRECEYILSKIKPTRILDKCMGEYIRPKYLGRVGSLNMETYCIHSGVGVIIILITAMCGASFSNFAVGYIVGTFLYTLGVLIYNKYVDTRNKKNGY